MVSFITSRNNNNFVFLVVLFLYFSFYEESIEYSYELGEFYSDGEKITLDSKADWKSVDEIVEIEAEIKKIRARYNAISLIDPID